MATPKLHRMPKEMQKPRPLSIAMMYLRGAPKHVQSHSGAFRSCSADGLPSSVSSICSPVCCFFSSLLHDKPITCSFFFFLGSNLKKTKHLCRCVKLNILHIQLFCFLFFFKKKEEGIKKKQNVRFRWFPAGKRSEITWIISCIGIRTPLTGYRHRYSAEEETGFHPPLAALTATGLDFIFLFYNVFLFLPFRSLLISPRSCQRKARWQTKSKWP